MASVAYQLVREVRLRAGLSQSALAARVGLHRSTIARYESSEVEPDLAVLTRIAEVCGFALHVELAIADPAREALIEEFAALTPAARLRWVTRNARRSAAAAARTREP